MTDPVPFLSPVDSLDYADGSLRPQRPATLVAVGAISILLCVVVPLANLVGIGLAIRLYIAHNPPAVSAAQTTLAPLQPATPPNPFQGDYLPTGGLSADKRTIVLDAVNKQAPMSDDRRAMFDRILAETGATAFANLNNALGSMNVRQKPAGPDGTGAMGTHVVTLPNGQFEIDNGNAIFTRADGSSPISVNGNIVHRPGFTGFTAGLIDDSINDLQRRSNAPMNAIQAGALAEEIRGLTLWNSSPQWDFPVLEPINSPGQGTFSVGLEILGSVPREQWILSNGYLIPDIIHGPFDPATGILVRNLPPPSFLVRQRPALPLDSWIINGSFVEHGLSMLLAPLLLIAGIRVLMDKPDGAWLHGIYVLIKPWLAIFNFYLGIWTILELSDVHFYTSMAETIAYIMAIVGFFVQLSYPIALIAIFSSIAVRRYEFKRGNPTGPAGPMYPTRALAAAAHFAPQQWGRAVAGLVIVVSLAVLITQALRLTSFAGDAFVRWWMSSSFVVPCAVAIVFLIGGIARIIKPGSNQRGQK